VVSEQIANLLPIVASDSTRKRLIQIVDLTTVLDEIADNGELTLSGCGIYCEGAAELVRTLAGIGGGVLGKISQDLDHGEIASLGGGDHHPPQLIRSGILWQVDNVVSKVADHLKMPAVDGSLDGLLEVANIAAVFDEILDYAWNSWLGQPLLSELHA
jgi:hypothetical protein